ncbi:DUF4913 domain-containing protein, partial [uncultured Arthrobacter sp.]|uniref:DUF4913 domain-containing protein n=1 Tax=uncultured Arthrobacter sp. TaxID=114050 RepID=UPI00321685F2
MSEGLGEWDDELEDTAVPTEPAEEESDAPELFYPNVAAFVSEKLATSYRRQLNVQGGVTWCPQWWKHAEAISRLEALWRAWEFLRPYVEHADAFLRVHAVLARVVEHHRVEFAADDLPRLRAHVGLVVPEVE